MKTGHYKNERYGDDREGREEMGKGKILWNIEQEGAGGDSQKI